MEIDILKFLWGISEPLCYIAIGAIVAIVAYNLYLKNVRDKFNSLPCETHQDTISNLPCGDHSKLFFEIKEDLAFIKGAFSTKSKNRFTQSHSPIGLSELGEKVAKDLSIQDKIEKNWTKIEPLIDEGTKSKNAYDIQQFCMEKPMVYPEEFFDEDSLNEIKNYAFETGDNIAEYMQMIGVIIRDEYFNKKGINKEEIDKYDPNKK